MGRNEQYELESILLDVMYHGHASLPLRKLYRLLGKGNRAAGTWKALLDAWEAVNGSRSDLHIFETDKEIIHLCNYKSYPVKSWASE